MSAIFSDGFPYSVVCVTQMTVIRDFPDQIRSDRKCVSVIFLWLITITGVIVIWFNRIANRIFGHFLKNLKTFLAQIRNSIKLLLDLYFYGDRELVLASVYHRFGTFLTLYWRFLIFRYSYRISWVNLCQFTDDKSQKSSCDFFVPKNLKSDRIGS